MYLKNLTVLGFKSFADKIALNFQPGITAVVGPNGCGKSNVADSVRWVLGEQSAKALRGGEMADIIFNGTDGRKALGMAEVSLTVGDVDMDNLKAAGVELDFNEVTLTRRVFRDGVSEYFINKVPCRLKDIQQLFMGTGVGRTSYSIMAQGHITQLLSSRPDDRRLVFEEAAGITRFKSQKKEALRKLEVTDQNLLRIDDLIREVKRQIGSLQRQAGKSRRYKQFMVELQHLDSQLARHQFDVLQTEIRERETSAEKLRIETEVCSEAILREEDEISQLRQRLSELEHLISQAQQNGLEVKGQIDRHESRIHFNEERLQQLEQQNAKALGDIAQGDERRAAAEQELATVVERLNASVAHLAQLREGLQAKRDALQEVENGLRSQQEALRQAQSASFSVAQQLSRIRNEITALDMQKQGNSVRLEKLSAEKIQLEEERIRLENRLQEFVTSVETEKLNVQLRRGTVEEQQRRLRELQQELTQVTRELDELLRQQAGSRSRLNVLEQLQTAHEGFSAGALAALKQEPQMLGALVDKIQVPGTYITAIEAALGHNLQLVLTEQPDTAQQILADLKSRNLGRASVAPLALCLPVTAEAAAGSASGDLALPQATVESVAGAPLSAPALSDAGEALGTNAPVLFPGQGTPPAVTPAAAAATPPPPNQRTQVNITPALSIIEAEAAVRPLLERLLRQTLIVSDLASALQAWRDLNGEYDLVTVTGEMLDRHAVFTGGSANGKDKSPASILGRKNQILELQAQLGQLQEQVNEVSRRKGASQSEQTSVQASLQQEQTELRSQEVAVATHQGECRALENASRLLNQKIETVMFEVESLAEQAEVAAQKRQALAAQVGEFEVRERDCQQQIADATGSLENLRQQRDVANNVLTETKVALATEEQLTASFRHQKESHEQRIRELTALVEQRRAEIAGLIEHRTQFQSEIQESRLKIDALQHELDQVRARAAELVGQKEELDGQINRQDEMLRERRRRISELQQQRGALDVELAQKQMAIQNLRERIQQKYQLNLDDVRSECITITIADEGPPKIETLTPEEMTQRGVATDWDSVAGQVAALQRRLDEMGPVNLVAIEEYEETEQRYTFLSTQHEDLVKAKEQLLEVINRINIQTREMFVETFNKVRENFGALFTEIFGGGKADLALVDDGDVLESGIDILARPPVKQLKSISLLSGGEQTMTAVALLFAIYQVKPSPFCILDELDAPLDESNVNRFIGVLKRFLEHSQFIIITHNKRTIGMADVIYGVTMQEQGVSKIVSMKFQKTIGTATEPPPALATQTESPAPWQHPGDAMGPAMASVPRLGDSIINFGAMSAPTIPAPEPAGPAPSPNAVTPTGLAAERREEGLEILFAK